MNNKIRKSVMGLVGGLTVLSGAATSAKAVSQSYGAAVNTAATQNYQDVLVNPNVVNTSLINAKPTATPSAKPGSKPTAKPTAKYTAKPSAKPTPTLSAKATVTPESKPTLAPSNEISPKATPSVDVKPTAAVETPVVSSIVKVYQSLLTKIKNFFHF